MTKKRRRSVHLHVMVTPEEQALIADRMAEAGISNMGAYMRKMALNGYVLHVDLSDIRELVALQRRCANNLNQVAVHANTYGIISWADMYDSASTESKKMIVSCLIRRVEVYRDYRLHIDFNIDFEQFSAGLDISAIAA